MLSPVFQLQLQFGNKKENRQAPDLCLDTYLVKCADADAELATLVATSLSQHFSCLTVLAGAELTRGKTQWLSY